MILKTQTQKGVWNILLQPSVYFWLVKVFEVKHQSYRTYFCTKLFRNQSRLSSYLNEKELTSFHVCDANIGMHFK